MRAMIHFAARFLRARKGATAVEYGLILAMIVLAMLAGVSQLSSTTGGLWGDINNKVQATN
ncbi:MAG: Flp family type IVb pilin [Pseudomonadota bacterium]